MTSRADIIDGSQAIGRKYGLIYTEKCGWIDLGHANPEGALTLWNQIKNEESIESENIPNDSFRIAYRQMMGRKNLVMVGIQKNMILKTVK